MARLVEQPEAHVVVGLLLSFLLFLFGLLGSGATSDSGGASRSGTSGTSRELGQESIDVLSVKSLGEQLGPDGLNARDTSSLGQSEKVVSGDFNLSIGKDEGSY